MNHFTLKYHFYLLLSLTVFCVSCKEDFSSPKDQYYYYLDRDQTSTLLEVETQNRLGKESDLYTLYHKDLISKNNNKINNYTSLIDSVTNYKMSLEKLKSLIDPKDWIDSTFIEEARYKQYESLDTIIIFPINKDHLLTFSQLSRSEQYQTLRHLILNCDKFDMSSRPLEENITIDLILHLFKSHTLENIFPGLYIDILQIKGTGFLTENEMDNIRYGELAKSYFEKELKHIEKHKLYKQKNIALTNLSEAYLKTGDTLKAIKLLEKNTSLYNSPYALQALALNYLDIDSNQLAIKCLSNIKELTGINDFNLNMDYARAHGQNNDFLTADKHFNICLKKIEQVDYKADSIEQLYFLHELGALLEKEKFNVSHNDTHLINAFNHYKERRNLGNLIFHQDISLHSNEFYAFNTENLLQSAYSLQETGKPISSKIINFLITCVLESKKINGLYDLNGYTRHTNDFTKSGVYQNELYLDNYIQFFENYNSKEITLDSPLITESKSTQLLNNNYTNLHFLKGRYYYWCISKNTASDKIYKIPVSSFERSIDKNFDALKNRSNTSIPKSKIWEQLNLNHKDTVIIHTDGILNEYPISSELNQVVYTNYFKSKATSLSSSSLSIFSYSSPITNRSMEPIEYNELMGGYNECLEIEHIFQHKAIYSGNDCNRHNFKTAMSNDILHITTHAYSDSINRLDSYIVLRDSTGDPIRLYADEILSMPHVPKFVNLSACQTGTGVHMVGAGTYSLAHSFLLKGSEAVMKTLWEVDDQATKEFMILFYTKWKEGMSCNDALMHTKQEFKLSAKYSSPYYWAGFILEGNPNLYISKN